MSSLSVMEWNAKPPLQWEWVNTTAAAAAAAAAAPASSKSTENNTKIWQTTTDWGMGIIDVDEQIASGSLISYQGDCGSGVSSAGTTRSFDLGRYASMSKRSKSTSLSSFSTEDIKLESDEEAGKGNPEDFISSSKKDVATAVFSSPTLDSSVCSGEPLLSLKLGKRAYFEDTSDGSNTSNFPPLIVKLKCPPAPAPDTTTATTSAKRIRSSIFHSTPAAPCCQVEGCNLDLSSAKDYHRKHKVCAIHSKSPKVIVNGAARRFCQQCSRFHGLAEFDENKRSCRKRLSDHNGRRRRPQHHPNGTHFNPLRLSTIIYGSVQSKGMLHHHHHLAAAAAATAATVTATHNHGNMLLPDSSMRRRRRRTVTALSDGGSYGVLPPLKGGATVVKIHRGGGGGLEESSLISFSSMDQDAPTKEFHRAPSLLSNDARDSYLQPPRSVPVASARDPPPPPPLQNTTTGMVKPWTYGIPPQSSPLGSGSELWHAEQWLVGNSSERQTMSHHHHNKNNNNNNNGSRRRSSSSHSFENSSSINFQEDCLLLSEGGGQHHEFGFFDDSMNHLN